MSLTKDYPNTNWATATETTIVPRILYPFKGFGSEAGIIYERDYMQARANYNPMALDTADATYTSAYLFQETVPEEAGPSLIAFTRRFGTVPSAFTEYSWDLNTFLGYYEDEASGTTAYRPQSTVVAPLLRYKTFAQNASGVFALTGNRLVVTKSFTDATEVNYVDSNTVPSLTTYQGYITASTEIQVVENTIERAYGFGNIWMQTQVKTVAQ
tara:strand:- start:488 stop:1126 length:639 start_codon:yes stop_codon:yes gene_type:complete